MNPAEALPRKITAKAETASANNPPVQSSLIEIKKDAKIILSDESSLAEDVSAALEILTTEIDQITAALRTKRPVEPQIRDILQSFFDDSRPEAQALRMIADQLTRVRILAQRRSESPRVPHLVK